jgi:hypothetical protein
VPRTVPFKQVKERKAPQGPKALLNGGNAVVPGQTTLDGRSHLANGAANGFTHAHEAEEAAALDPNAQLEMENRRARMSAGQDGQHAYQDVEMS